MGLYLDTRGRATLGIGICDRCGRKFPLGELRSDPNAPGLKVCRADRDELDPYRLAPREPDQITLRFVRPDTDIATPVPDLLNAPENQTETVSTGDVYPAP